MMKPGSFVTVRLLPVTVDFPGLHPNTAERFSYTFLFISAHGLLEKSPVKIPKHTEASRE